MTTKLDVKCPKCSLPFKADLCLDGSNSTPKKGDYTVCGKCATLLVFNTDKTCREATASDVREIAPSNSIKILMVQQIIEQKRGCPLDS